MIEVLVGLFLILCIGMIAMAPKPSDKKEDEKKSDSKD